MGLHASSAWLVCARGMGCSSRRSKDGYRGGRRWRERLCGDRSVELEGGNEIEGDVGLIIMFFFGHEDIGRRERGPSQREGYGGLSCGS